VCGFGDGDHHNPVGRHRVVKRHEERVDHDTEQPEDEKTDDQRQPLRPHLVKCKKIIFRSDQIGHERITAILSQQNSNISNFYGVQLCKIILLFLLNGCSLVHLL